jgi:hypothetical protein
MAVFVGREMVRFRSGDVRNGRIVAKLRAVDV